MIVTLAPLLFVTFSTEFSLSLGKITLLTTANFAAQMLFDIVCAPIVRRIGYRGSMIVSHLTVAVGLVLMAVLPDMLSDPYLGLIIATLVFGSGGGIAEVVVNPIVISCPAENRTSALSLLHSFFCWGQVIVVAISAVFFAAFGTGEWRYLVIMWAIVPIANSAYFALVPMNETSDLPEHRETKTRNFASKKIFWVFIILMLCAGASEHAMSQWASAFAETALGVSKSVGDMAGLCAFAVMMGLSRTLFGRHGTIDLHKAIVLSAVLCAACFALAAFSPFPLLALAGCALCGFSVGIFWPGIFSLASETAPAGGTAMFAILSLAGDIGCAGGPAVVGFTADIAGGGLGTGLAVAIVFPIAIIICLAAFGKSMRPKTVYA